MTRSRHVWLVDPISYSGLAYYDASLVMALRATGVPVILVGSDDWLLAGRPDISVPQLPLFRGTSTGHRALRAIRYAVSILRVVGVAMLRRPAIAHWQYTQLVAVDALAMGAMRLAGIRLVYTAHEIVPWRVERALARRALRAIYRTADRVIVHNEADADALHREFGVPSRRVRVIPHGDYALFATPELDQETARRQLQLPPSVPIALFFGTLRASKGVDVLIEAWPRVLERVPGAHLVVAGQPDRDLPARILAQLRTTARQESNALTLRLGKISDTEVSAYYRAADVVVLPYRAITTSGVLRYAYSSGRPVVATAVGEHPNWVVPGVTGELVPPGDPDSLATVLASLLRDRDRTARLGRQARRYAREQFDWARIAALTAAVYSELCSTGDPYRDATCSES